MRMRIWREERAAATAAALMLQSCFDAAAQADAEEETEGPNAQAEAQAKAVRAAEEEARRAARSARLQKQLSERNADGNKGYLLTTLECGGERGVCFICLGGDDPHHTITTDTITPCCSFEQDGQPRPQLQWLCARCVDLYRASYARSGRDLTGPSRSNGAAHYEKDIDSCPTCRAENVFARGHRGLVRVV